VKGGRAEDKRKGLVLGKIERSKFQKKMRGRQQVEVGRRQLEKTGRLKAWARGSLQKDGSVGLKKSRATTKNDQRKKLQWSKFPLTQIKMHEKKKTKMELEFSNRYKTKKEGEKKSKERKEEGVGSFRAILGKGFPIVCGGGVATKIKGKGILRSAQPKKTTKPELGLKKEEKRCLIGKWAQGKSRRKTNKRRCPSLT